VPGGTTARTLAPSKEAFDAPLSPPPLDDRPGPATGRTGAYPDGTLTRWSGPAFRTHHDAILRNLASLTAGFASWELRSGRLSVLHGMRPYEEGVTLILEESPEQGLGLTPIV